uniref:Uncharacterized protein n=1 Tax=Astyanax mexicanus TaxID=7994 RepID=A0A8B9HIF5_ASTMX
MGRRCAKDGTCPGLSFDVFVLSASDLLAFISGVLISLSRSGNCGSSGSTIMCFFRRVQPLSFDFRTLGFWVSLGFSLGSFSATSVLFFSVVSELLVKPNSCLALSFVTVFLIEVSVGGFASGTTVFALEEPDPVSTDGRSIAFVGYADWGTFSLSADVCSGIFCIDKKFLVDNPAVFEFRMLD